MLKSVLVATAVLGAVAHPCDKEHEEECPTHGPDSLGSCLQKVKTSEECQKWMTLHTKCEADFAEGSGKCAEHKYTNDAELCVRSWTARSDLSMDCAEHMDVTAPKQDSADSDNLSPEALRRKRERKAIRDAAAKRMQEEKEPPKKKKGKKSKKKAKKEEL